MAIIEFDIQVENPDQISALYDVIDVLRSDSESGSYVRLTEDEAEAASLEGSIEGPWNVSGQTLTIALDGGEEKSINFASANPVLYQSVRNILNAVYPTFAPDLASEVPTDTGRLQLTSPTTGTQSSLLVGGTAATTLGLSTTKVNGKSASPLLSANTEVYTFRDYDGNSGHWYKTRYRNTATGALSTLSAAFQPGATGGLSGSAVVTGRVALADVTGAPIVGRRIIIVPVGAQVISDGGGNNYGVLQSVNRIEAETDARGRATVTLVKGQRVKVFLEGTTFQREFIVPTADFDILQVASAEADPFSIVQAPPMPIRS